MPSLPQESKPADASPPAPATHSPVSLWFRLAGFSGALFCVTAIAWAAAGVGDQRHPMKAWLGKHGTTLIIVESLAVLLTTLLGMLLPEKESGLTTEDRNSDPTSTGL